MFRIMKEIPGEKEIHNVFLIFKDDGEFMPLESSCTCIFGSFYGHSKANKGKVCDHVNLALNEYDKEEQKRFMKLTVNKKI